MDDTSEASAPATDSRSYVIITVASVLLAVVSTVVGLRLYTRLSLVRSIGLSDWVITLASVFIIATGVVMGVMTKFGLGKHISTLNPGEIEQYLMGFYLSIVFYYISLGLIKLGLLLQYYPLVAVKHRKLMTILIAIICIWSAVVTFTAIFPCSPVRGFWDKNINAVCIPTLPLWYCNAAGNIITDIIIFTLPIPVVWKLQMPRRERLSLCGVFCLGFFTCTVSVLRIDFLNNGDDTTYNNIKPAGWSLGEISSGLVCACLPTLRPLLFRFRNMTPKERATTPSSGHPGVIPLRGRLSRKLSVTLLSLQTIGETGVETGDYDPESNGSSKGLGDRESSSPDGSRVEAFDEIRPQAFRNVM